MFSAGILQKLRIPLKLWDLFSKAVWLKKVHILQGLIHEISQLYPWSRLKLKNWNFNPVKPAMWNNNQKPFMEQFIEPSHKILFKRLHILLLCIIFDTSGIYGSFSMI